MDARSVAATAANGGFITPATEAEYVKKIKKYYFDGGIYDKKVYRGAGKPDCSAELVYGNNITDYPKQIPLTHNTFNAQKQLRRTRISAAKAARCPKAF